MHASGRIDQLPGNAYPITAFAHRAFKHIPNPKLPPNLPYIDCLTFVGKARISCDHEQPANATQRGDDFLDHTIDEIFLFGIAAHVLEGQNRNRGLVRQGEHGLALGQRSGRRSLNGGNPH
jgi:hypothetical protein